VDEPLRAVESVLFASSRPLRMAEIEGATQLTPDVIRRAIVRLKKQYDDVGSSVEVVKIGVRYSMQLRKRYSMYGMPFAEVELPKDALKTAAFIAYNQPVLQSDLAKSLGSEIYEHIKILRSANLITAKRYSHTFQLTTSKHFADYFGIASSKKEDIKKWMDEQTQKQ
jgi:segregation and condensation protein B